MDNLLSRSVLPPMGPSEVLPALLRPELVQRHLEKVLLSAEMCRSKMLCQFLRFTVEEVLRGHGSELKEYAIAVGVFRRSREFDPGSDPIVRVQARRLRSKLERYYRTEGAGEPIRIQYRVGGYSPIFLRNTAAGEIPGTTPAALTGAVREGSPFRLVAVLPFEDLGPEDSHAFSDGLTDDLIHAISNWPGVRVVARTSSNQFRGKSEDVRRIGEWLGVSTIVTGSVRREGSHLRVLVQLIDTGTGLNLWSGACDREMKGMLATQVKTSGEMAALLESKLAGFAFRSEPKSVKG